MLTRVGAALKLQLVVLKDRQKLQSVDAQLLQERDLQATKCVSAHPVFLWCDASSVRRGTASLVSSAYLLLDPQESATLALRQAAARGGGEGAHLRSSASWQAQCEGTSTGPELTDFQDTKTPEPAGAWRRLTVVS